MQIGNTDERLSRKQWILFIEEVHYLLDGYGKLHFSGFSYPLAQWQNACFVAEIQSPDWIRKELAKLAKRFNQDSIATIFGDVEFIGAYDGTVEDSLSDVSTEDAIPASGADERS